MLAEPQTDLAGTDPTTAEQPWDSAGTGQADSRPVPAVPTGTDPTAAVLAGSHSTDPTGTGPADSRPGAAGPGGVRLGMDPAAAGPTGPHSTAAEPPTDSTGTDLPAADQAGSPT